ncbi:hypothetical protein ES707_09934 [subsurface metagenome]
MTTDNPKEQGGASQANLKSFRRGRTAAIGDDMAGALKSIAGSAGAGPAQTGKGKRRRGLRGRLLPAVVCHPRLGWRDMIGLAVIYALPGSGPDAGLRGGVKRLYEILGGSRYRWGKRVKKWKRMKLVWRKRVRGERALRIVRAGTIPRAFWRAAGAECKRLGLVQRKTKGGRAARGLAALGYFDLPPGLVSERGLTLPARMIWAWLLWHTSWGPERRAWPSTRTIARRLRMRPVAVRRSLAELQAVGAIVENGRKARGVRIWAVHEAVSEVTQPGAVGDPTGRSKWPNRAHINSIPYNSPSIACTTTEKSHQMQGAKGPPEDQSAPGKSPQVGTANAANPDGPIIYEVERPRQIKNLYATQAIADRQRHATRGRSVAATKADEIRRVAARIDGPGDARFALTALGMHARRTREAVEKFDVPTIRGTILELANRIERGERILNHGGWITEALRGKWARPATAGDARRAAAGDATNAPAEIQIVWTPEARAAHESGRLPECTWQEFAEQATACMWPRVAWSVWADVIRHSDPATAAALKKYLAATDRDAPASPKA